MRVLSVDPGEMNTRMHAEAIPDADTRSLLEPEIVAQRILQLMRRGGALANGARVEAGAWGAFA